MIREYARHVQGFGASAEGAGELAWHKTAKDTWQVETGGARRIRASGAIAETRLVLYSSIDDRSSRKELRKLGFAGHLSKPMRRAELLATMERVLSAAPLEFTQRLRAIVTRDVIVEDHQRRGRPHQGPHHLTLRGVRGGLGAQRQTHLATGHREIDVRQNA